MKLFEIKPLLSDMACNGAKKEKFNFVYNGVKFDVIVLIEREPFELLFGVVGYNFSFKLNLYKGYELETLKDEVFYRLCDILQLKPSREGFNSYIFLKYFAKRIPNQYSKKMLQPHEIAIYKRDVPEEEKIYFYGWKFYTNSERHARNFEKTRKWLGNEAYCFCKEHDISSCWTDKVEKRLDYFTPQRYYSQHKGKGGL